LRQSWGPPTWQGVQDGTHNGEPFSEAETATIRALTAKVEGILKLDIGLVIPGKRPACHNTPAQSLCQPFQHCPGIESRIMKLGSRHICMRMSNAISALLLPYNLAGLHRRQAAC
jgi:hypothetical protein